MRFQTYFDLQSFFFLFYRLHNLVFFVRALLTDIFRSTVGGSDVF